MPLVARRTEKGRVRVALWRDDTAAMTVEISETEARALAASLLVAASADAADLTERAREGAELARSGADFLGRLQKLAKGGRR